MSKTKKFLACVVLLCFVFVSTADALLWFLAGVIRAGVVAVSTFISTPMGQSIVRSAVNHAMVLGGLAYLYYDRGAAVPSGERYIQVSLTNTKAAVQELHNQGSIFSGVPAYPPPAGGCTAPHLSNPMPGSNVSKTSISAPSSPCGGSPIGENIEFTWPILYQGPPYDVVTSWASAHFLNENNSYPASQGWYVCGWYYQGYQVNNGQHKGTYYLCKGDPPPLVPISGADIDNAVNHIFTNDDLKGYVQDAVGRDIQAGGTLVASPVAGEPVITVGEGGTSKEWPSGTSEQEIESWFNNAPSGGSSPSASASDIGSAVGSAVNPALNDLKVSTNAVKASVDAVNEKVGNNPGSASVPSYDSDYTNPVENNISDRIGSFIGSNPIIGAINGSHLSLSGAVCSVSNGSSVFGKPLTLDFCWMESYLKMFGNVMVIFAGLTAAFIIFRRGD